MYQQSQIQQIREPFQMAGCFAETLASKVLSLVSARLVKMKSVLHTLSFFQKGFVNRFVYDLLKVTGSY